MDFFTIALGGVAVLFALVAAGLGLGLEKARKKAKALEIQLAGIQATSAELQKDAIELGQLRAENKRYLEEKAIAEAQLKEKASQLSAAQQQKDEAQRARDHAIAQQHEANQQVALMRQQIEQQDKRMRDWQEQQEQFTRMAQSSILEAGSKMSSKLLEDHKRETEAAKKESEEITKKTTDSLMEQVKTIASTVSSLKDQTTDNKEKMSTVMRALSSPGGAGSLAEVGLENSLKNLDLQAGRDYVMQYAISGSEGQGGLRPDAIVFLPQDVVIVVDCKASKFLLDLAEAEGTEREALALENLKRTMNTHLKALADKEYGKAVHGAFKAAGKGDSVRYILNVMYLPNEGAIDKLKKADPEFGSKIDKAGLILSGPASLAGLFSLARLNIGMARQAENQETIIALMQDALDNFINLFGYADKVGRGIKQSADAFEQFASSINRRMLPKLRKLTALGVRPGKGKQLPARITSYDVRASDDLLMIEGESEVVEEATEATLSLPQTEDA